MAQRTRSRSLSEQRSGQSDEKGPAARRRPRAAREAYSLYVERAAEGRQRRRWALIIALDRARGDVDGQGEERGVEHEGHDAMGGDGAADLLARDAHVGDLRGHADDEGEVDEVPVVRLDRKSVV